MGDISTIQPAIDAVQDVVLQIVLPILGSLVVAALGWAATQAARVLGEQRAAALKQKIVEALINSLTKEAGVNTPGAPTFNEAVSMAADYVQTVAYPAATAKLEPEALKTMAAKELNGLIADGAAQVEPSPFRS